MGQRDVVQGTLEMLILKTLVLEPMHGYGVALRIEQVSKGVSRQPGIVAAGAGPHGACWERQERVACKREQSPRQVLHVNCSRTQGAL